MPVARVQINGRIARIDVPEGTTPEQAQAIAMRMVNQRSASPPPKPTSFLQGVAEGITPYASNALRALNKINPVLGVIDAVSGGPTKMADTAEHNVNTGLSRSPYRGSTMGKLTGEVIGSLPTMALPGGPAVQGAAAGLLGSRDRSAKGLATNAAIGGAGGYLGNKVIGAAANVISPRVAPAIAALRARGIPLTLGQIAGANGSTGGRLVRGVENKLTSVPGVGDAIVNAQRRGTEAFNRAAFNEAVGPVGGSVGQVAEPGVELARGAVRDAYANALDHVRLAPDQQFADELVAAAQRGLAPGQYSDDFARIMQDEIQPILASPTGELSGKNVQDALRALKGYARQYGKLGTTGANGIPQPAARPVGEAFSQLADSMEGMVGRQASDVLPALNAANQAHRNVGVVRDAVNAAKNSSGVFTPAQLSAAARANAKKFGGTHGTTNQPFFDLTRAAQDVLPNNIPNSGTADRGIIGMLIGGTVGLPAVAASGAAALPYTRGGQKAAEWMLAGRQGPTSRAVAEALRKLRPFGVGAGAVGLSGLLGS